MTEPNHAIEVVVDAPDEFSTLNQLEAQATHSEAQASDVRWEQAEEVARLHKQGYTHRDIAERWVSSRTGQPYSHAHVGYVIKTWKMLGNLSCQERPPWNEAYNSNEVRGKGAHVANNSGEIEWYTPPVYIAAAIDVLGAIDLDPASCAAANERIGAARIYTETDNGLNADWNGRVFLNPPYKQPLIGQFCDKLVDEYQAGRTQQAIVLTNNATETLWWQTLAATATAICFHRGRISFWRPDIESKTPLQGQTFCYFGHNPDRFDEVFRTFGIVVS